MNFDIADEYNFSNGKRGAVLSHKGKTRITIWIDNKVLDWFKTQAEEKGQGYQTALNEALRGCIQQKSTSLPSMIRKILREELKRWAT